MNECEISVAQNRKLAGSASSIRSKRWHTWRTTKRRKSWVGQLMSDSIERMELSQRTFKKNNGDF